MAFLPRKPPACRLEAQRIPQDGNQHAVARSGAEGCLRGWAITSAPSTSSSGQPRHHLAQDRHHWFAIAILVQHERMNTIEASS